MKKAIWKNKKYGKKEFTGGYRLHDGEREFFLTPMLGGKKITFESHEAAKKLGWLKA